MLKVEPHFKLDGTFRGPYCVESVTSTNVVIRPVNDPTAEPWNVSIQRVSRCSEALSAASPWYGHGGKNRKRRQIRKPGRPQTESTEQVDSQPVKTTTCGRPIRKPARYWTSAVPQGPAQKGGGSCKTVAAGARRSTEESGDRRERSREQRRES